MSIFDNIFVKKAIKSVLSNEQFEALENFSNGLESGEIDRVKLQQVSKKVANLTPKEIDALLDVIDKHIR
jgi:hypothetical protein